MCTEQALADSVFASGCSFRVNTPVSCYRHSDLTCRDNGDRLLSLISLLVYRAIIYPQRFSNTASGTSVQPRSYTQCLALISTHIEICTWFVVLNVGSITAHRADEENSAVDFREPSLVSYTDTTDLAHAGFREFVYL